MRRAAYAFPLAVLATSGLALSQTAGPPTEPTTAAEEEEVAVEEGPQPDAKNGVIRGKLVDGSNEEEIIDGQCKVEGTTKVAVSDVEGVFAIKLPPGNYQLRCYFEGFKTTRVDNVAVIAGKTSTLRVALDHDVNKAPEEEVVVEVDPDRGSTANQLLLRKFAPASSDAVSAKEIAKTPDRNAADASKRVVGATVVDGRFIYVRGLGDRYTNSLLNGTPLPSPEPDLQTIPLDIFPVSVLSDVTILKTFTPDMPADFAGGSVRIQTRSFPTKFFASWSFTGGYNTSTTFKNRTTYDGSKTDWLGMDAGSRKMASNIAGTSGLLSGPPARMEWYGESLNQAPRKLFNTISAPNYGVAFTMGDTIQLGGNPLGYILGVGYSRRWAFREETQRTFEESGDPKSPLIPTVDFAGTRSNSFVTISGLANIGYQIGKDHRFTMTGLYSGTSEDDILQLSGNSKNDSAFLSVERARWVERRLYFLQIVGEHKLPALADLFVKWNAFLGVATRGEPNNVQSVYSRSIDDPTARFEAKSSDGLTHFFSDQKETAKGVGIDFTQPLAKGDEAPKLKAGGLFSVKDRDFGARRFRFMYQPRVGQLDWLRTPAASILNDETIGTFARVEENTRATDVYAARQRIYAGYLMADVPIGPLRLVGGARLEAASLSVISHDDLATGAPLTKDGFKKADVLPSLGAIFRMTDAMNLRASVTQTVARPQFREIARFDYSDFFNAQLAVGNPDLKRTLITNVDFRWEWFPSGSEVVAASVFYKHFDDPIETAYVNSTSSVTRRPQNAKSARNLGIELEGRKRLDFLGAALSGFSVLGNLTIVDSKVKLADDQVGIATSLERPLSGQSPYVVNVALDWSSKNETTRARLSYNVFGRRIDTVGTRKIPDTFEMPRHTFDLAVSQQLDSHIDLKLSVENLFNAPYLFKTGDLEAQRWKVGQTIWLSMSTEL
jgi:outer membrane receptor protein involved in Fe transport